MPCAAQRRRAVCLAVDKKIKQKTEEGGEKAKKKTVGASKVGRVNEFPYQIRAASCHQSLLLSLPSINTTYSRTARLANNIKTAADIHLYRCSIVMGGEKERENIYEEKIGETNEKKGRKRRRKCAFPRNVGVFLIGKGENSEDKAPYSQCASSR